MENTNVNGINEKPKTLEELAVNEILDLRRKNEVLNEVKKTLTEQVIQLGKVLENIQKDFNVELRETSSGVKYIHFETLFDNIKEQKEKFEFYKRIFNLKEEGEEDNE